MIEKYIFISLYSCLTKLVLVAVFSLNAFSFQLIFDSAQVILIRIPKILWSSTR